MRQALHVLRACDYINKPFDLLNDTRRRFQRHAAPDVGKRNP